MSLCLHRWWFFRARLQILHCGGGNPRRPRRAWQHTPRYLLVSGGTFCQRVTGMSAEHLEALFGLRGKVALVTGASSGLGVEFAQGLAMAGADVAVVARRRERLQAVAKQLEAFGVRAHAVQADLRDEAQIDAALQQAQETLGPIDIL